MGHLPPMVFERCVARYGGNHKVKSFTCMDQYLCTAFARAASLLSFGRPIERPDLRSDDRATGLPVRPRLPRDVACRAIQGPETGKRLLFITNNTALPALSICALYKAGWQVELFFWLFRVLCGSGRSCLNPAALRVSRPYARYSPGAGFRQDLPDPHDSLKSLLFHKSFTTVVLCPFSSSE